MVTIHVPNNDEFEIGRVVAQSAFELVAIFLIMSLLVYFVIGWNIREIVTQIALVNKFISAGRLLRRFVQILVY